jgi:hypothetical protein
LVSTFCFSSSFILLTTGSWFASPVVWVVLAGGLALGIDVCSGGALAGRVAVVLGGELFWAWAGDRPKRKPLDSSDTGSVIRCGVLDLIFIDHVFIDLAPVRSMKTYLAV